MKRIAVLIPCYNEELTVAGVVADFRAALPEAEILVFDNNSQDRTAALAAAAGARVITSPRQGKGYVVRHMFASVDADFYLMVDGDATYPAAAARRLLELVASGKADMAVGRRLTSHAAGAFRQFHTFGNHLVARLISALFGVQVTDVLSGYRAFSRDFVKSIPLLSAGFEIETEMTLQAISKNFTIVEADIDYGTRPAGSFSKLNTFSDGFRVLRSMFLIFKDYQPLVCFATVAVLLFVLSLLAGTPPILDYVRNDDHFVEHVPLAVLAAALGILGSLSLSIGLILDTLSKYHQENFALHRRLIQERPSPADAAPRE